MSDDGQNVLSGHVVRLTEAVWHLESECPGWRTLQAPPPCSSHQQVPLWLDQILVDSHVLLCAPHYHNMAVDLNLARTKLP